MRLSPREAATRGTAVPEPEDRSAVEQVRRDKLAALRSAGIDAYPVGFPRSHDGHELQAMLTVDALGADQFAVALDLDLGDWVGVQGPVVKTRKGELSVKAIELFLLGKALRPLPDKWKGLTDVEVRSRQRELDLTVNAAARAAMRLRSRVVQSLRSSMLGRDFMEVETPILNQVPGGALARPFVTHHNALDTDLYLRVACELYLKRLLVGGVDRVFELGRVFRNEGIDATHNTEFTMLESNSAFQDYRDMMELARGVILEAADTALGSRRVR